jgi:hypothetical protein
MESSQQSTQKVIVVQAPKSPIVAFILTFLFGPLGLLYVSVTGGLVLILAAILSFFILPLIGGIIIWIISIIWGVVGAMNSKKNSI